MNFLAHIFLSGDNPGLIVGNFMGDSVKGRLPQDDVDDITHGVILHRAIDSFTDSHETVRRSTARLHKNYGKYSGVIVDIFYDHFLAHFWEDFSHEPFSDFVSHRYQLLSDHVHLMPEPTQNMLPYMVKYDWLTSYTTVEGIESALNGLSRRVPHDSGMERAGNELRSHYTEFENEFREFFPEMQAHAAEVIHSRENT